jgi:hypothetical protein
MDARIKSGHDGCVLWSKESFAHTHTHTHTHTHQFQKFQTAKTRYAFPDTRSRPRGAMRPSRAFISRPKEGVGNAGCPLHPRPRVRFAFGKKHTSIRVHRNHPAFPHAMVLTAYVALSSVTGLFCHRRLRIRFCLSPVGPTQLRELDTSVGASGPHDFAVRCNISRPLAW